MASSKSNLVGKASFTVDQSEATLRGHKQITCNMNLNFIFFLFTSVFNERVKIIEHELLESTIIIQTTTAAIENKCLEEVVGGREAETDKKGEGASRTCLERIILSTAVVVSQTVSTCNYDFKEQNIS